MIKDIESDSDDGQSGTDEGSSSNSDNSGSSSSSNTDSESDSNSNSSNKRSSSGSSSGSEGATSNDENHDPSKDLSHSSNPSVEKTSKVDRNYSNVQSLSGSSSESEAESGYNDNTWKNLSNSSSASSNSRSKKKYWEENPDMYGIRRSARERKQPERMTLVGSTKHQRRGSNYSSDESHTDDSDCESQASYQQRVRKKAHPLTSKKKKPNYSDDISKRTFRSTGGKVSYKEDSDSPSASEHDEKSVAYEIAEGDESTQTIDKVVKHRMGKKGAVGQQTYIYEVEKKGDPNTDFDPEDSSQTELQFLIKWKGWAHIHNTWESHESLRTQKVKGMKKLDNYMQREDDQRILKLRCTPEEVEYTAIQSEMEQELLMSHLSAERIFADAVENDIEYYYVKWENLPYSEATWENEQIVNERLPSHLAAFQGREESTCYPKPVAVLKQRPWFQPLKTQPDYIGMNDTFLLRDYQLDGLNWLNHAWTNHNSVILADEMGLGKTIQAISFLSYLFHAHELYGPFLLVLPLSTINAWLKEFSQWAPDMNVIVYIGDRDSRKIIHDYEWVSKGSRRIKFNAVLTTYEILLRDKDLLQDSCQWACLIVDEAHRLKNEESQLYHALMGFKTNYRLLITGTPLQNSLKELWALLHFIMPVKFNNCEYFESHKIREHLKKGIERLHKELEPFILRRVKKEVEKSLPLKVERILRVDMTQCQKRYYKYILTRNFEKLKRGKTGSASSFINIVMELKKCCNHATLIRQEEDFPSNQHECLQRLLRGSGKLLLLDKLLVRLHETGHRVLIFSQMVMMLDILAYYMQLRRFTFQRLDGSICGELRRQALDHFNAEGSSDFCFLLSTRAGGLGINLATADTVIIFDSDWNPQNDLQAQARAHRIGQKNQVNIFRLVTKNSIEENIIERAKQKMVLDHLVIQSMDTSGRMVFNKKLTGASSTPFNKEELNAILKFGAEELFKDDGELEGEDNNECDIDEILSRAETRDEGPSSAGDDLLSAFKVASFNFEEPQKIDPTTGESKDWDEIIPEGVRNVVAEEEKQKEMAKLYLPPRKRNALNKSDKTSPKEKVRRRRGGSDFSDKDSDQDRPRRRGRPRMHHKETVKGFGDAEVRRFFKSFKKFSNPLRRLDVIANNAFLRDKREDDLRRLGEIIIERCKETLRDHKPQKFLNTYNETTNGGARQRRDRGPSFKLSGVAINARSTLAALDELEPLDLVVPHAPVERASWVLQLKRVKDAHWDMPWGINEDSRLLRGIFEFGMGSWEEIKQDATLNLADKILLGNEVKPQAKHLENRAQYLLKLLKKSAHLHINRKPIKSKSKRLAAKEPKCISKEIIDDDSTADEATSHSTISATKSSPKNEHIKVEAVTMEKEKPKDEHVEYKIEHISSKHKKSKKDKYTELPVTNGEPSPIDNEVELNQTHPKWIECKEKMRPLKKALKTLDNPSNCSTEEEQLRNTRRCLLEIGDHIERVLQEYISQHEKHSQWKLLLWQFVSKFTEYDAKKLHKLYKKHKKEKEEKSHRDKEERSKSEHKDHKRSKRKLDDDAQQNIGKRPHNGWSIDRQSKEADTHCEDRNTVKKRQREWSNDGYNRNYDRHASGSRDHSTESHARTAR